MEDAHIQHLHDLQSIILSYINYINQTGDLIDFKGSDETIFHEDTHSFFKKILHVLYDQTKIYSLFTNPRHSTNLMADHEHVWLVDVVNPRKREKKKNMLGAYRSYYLTWRNFIYKKALSLHLAKIKKRIALLQQQYITEYVNPPADL